MLNSKSNHSKIVVFGAGRHAIKVLRYISDLSLIAYIVDNDIEKWDKVNLVGDHNFMVYSPVKILEENLDALTIIISSTYEDDIINQIAQLIKAKGKKPIYYKVLKERDFSVCVVNLINDDNPSYDMRFEFYPFRDMNMIDYILGEGISADIESISCLYSSGEALQFDPPKIVTPDYHLFDDGQFNILNDQSNILIKNESTFDVIFMKLNITKALQPIRYQRSFCREAYPDGINLIGFIRGAFGLGQGSRLLAEAVDATELNWTAFSYENLYEGINYDDNTWSHKISNTFMYNINLIHINALEFSLVCSQLGKSFRRGRYNIAFWLWELDVFPSQWVDAINLVDEIWTPAEFISSGIRKITNKPVCTIPYPVSAPVDESIDREFFNLPKDKFLYLCMFDTNSCIERKNPFGAISAYKLAFPVENPDVGLVIKAIYPSNEELDEIRRQLEGYNNVYFILETLPKNQVNSLIACSDVFVSLHRAEGFGLVLAEAMLLGTPVVATNWSANTEFMNSDVACMVSYEFVTIEKDLWRISYKKGSRWAEPDLTQAAEFMKRLFEDRVYYQSIAHNAKEFISDKLDKKRIASLIASRINEIYSCPEEK